MSLSICESFCEGRASQSSLAHSCHSTYIKLITFPLIIPFPQTMLAHHSFIVLNVEGVGGGGGGGGAELDACALKPRQRFVT